MCIDMCIDMCVDMCTQQLRANHSPLFGISVCFPDRRPRSSSSAWPEPTPMMTTTTLMTRHVGRER